MRRKAVSMEQERMAAQQEGFIAKIGSLPIVNSAWTQACGMYTRTKESNSLLRVTCNLAEGGVKTFAATTMPLVVKCQPQISQMDAYACQQLARLEESYPVITQETEEVLKESKEKCSALLKPVTDKVTSVQNTYTEVINKSRDTVEAARNVVPNTLTKVKEMGMNTVTRSMETPYGQFVNEKVNDALAFSEEYLEKYFPPSESDEDCAEKEEPDEGMVARVTTLSGKVRHRMYRRAMKDLRGLQTRSQETLSKLNFTVDLIQYAKTNINDATSALNDKYISAQKKVMDTWHEVVDEEVKEDVEIDEAPESLERRTILTARRLTRHMRDNVTKITSYLPGHLQPGAVKERLNNAKQFSEDLYQSFKQAKGFDDMPAKMLGQMRDRMSYLQETVTFLMDTFLVSPVGWLVPVLKPVKPSDESSSNPAPPTDLDKDKSK